MVVVFMTLGDTVIQRLYKRRSGIVLSCIRGLGIQLDCKEGVVHSTNASTKMDVNVSGFIVFARRLFQNNENQRPITLV